MDELFLNEKKYISARQASLITGYAPDYVGQLCRGGRIDAVFVGRNWFVAEESLLGHKEGGRRPHQKLRRERREHRVSPKDHIAGRGVSPIVEEERDVQGTVHAGGVLADGCYDEKSREDDVSYASSVSHAIPSQPEKIFSDDSKTLEDDNVLDAASKEGEQVFEKVYAKPSEHILSITKPMRTVDVTSRDTVKHNTRVDGLRLYAVRQKGERMNNENVQNINISNKDTTKPHKEFFATETINTNNRIGRDFNQERSFLPLHFVRGASIVLIVFIGLLALISFERREFYNVKDQEGKSSSALIFAGFQSVLGNIFPNMTEKD